MGKSFNRMSATVMMSAISSIMNSGIDQYERQRQISNLGPYVSRGKGGRKSPRTFSGVARARREAKKARNKSA